MNLTEYLICGSGACCLAVNGIPSVFVELIASQEYLRVSKSWHCRFVLCGEIHQQNSDFLGLSHYAPNPTRFPRAGVREDYLGWDSVIGDELVHLQVSRIDESHVESHVG